MKGAAYWGGALVAVVCGLGTSVLAAEQAEVKVTDRDRLWLNFNREAAVLGNNGFWLEVRGTLLQQGGGSDEVAPLSGYAIEGFQRGREFPIDDINGGRFDLIGAYGLGDRAELGLDLPFVQQQQIDFDVPTTCSSETSDCSRFQDDVGVGDLVLYGKYKHAFTEEVAGALGLEMSIPTGDEDELMGSGELGLNPFVSTRYQSGRVAVGGHLGFLLNTDDQPDVFNWSVNTILRANHLLALRFEFTGRLFRDFGNTYNDITLYPGIDFNLTENFIIRPQGIAGLTDAAVDWGLGIGFVFAMLPAPAAPAPPPPSPPAPVAAPPPAPIKKKIVLRGVNFDFDKSNIRPDAVAVLETACQTLKSEPSIDVSCDGYTDSIGTEEYNQRLSERRAEAVRDWLVQCGIPSSRLTTRGGGESNPVASNETEEGRAQNRRTELVVTNP